jgi:hypothetical protein
MDLPMALRSNYTKHENCLRTTSVAVHTFHFYCTKKAKLI